MAGTHMFMVVLMAGFSLGMCNVVLDPTKPLRHQRLVGLLQQAQANINPAFPHRNPFTNIWNQQPYYTRRRLLNLYIRHLLNLYLRSRYRHSLPLELRQGGVNHLDFDGRDRTVRTPYGSITYDGSDVSYNYY